jgi:hypothetical protein
MSSKGILYIASGEKYIQAAIQSAKSVLKHSPDLSTHLFADWDNYNFHFDKSSYPFTSVDKVDNPHRRSKVDYLPLTPYDQTLYLDTDTTLNADIRDMFRVLERFDIALTHAMKRNIDYRLTEWRIKLPQAFPQYNGGVLLYRKTPEVIAFLEEWRDQYHANIKQFQQDQRTLRELLWLSDLRLATLPPEYNVRYIKYHYFWSKSEAETKIFHLHRYHIGWFAWLLRPFSKKAHSKSTRRAIKRLLFGNQKKHKGNR